MADNARPPVAVRIVRPYDSEEAFLESELETVGKTSVILIGAHARPQGVILRFEVTLQSGVVILRGEGRVLQHKDSAFRGQSGLALRFTRLDPKSKALVDRAAAIREARLSGSMPPQPVPTPPESSSTPISIPEPDPTPPPPTPPRAESRPPTQPPPPASELPNPLVAMPSFGPMALPSSIPSNLPSGLPAVLSPPPAAPNATVAPDAMLAHILTAATPAPPPLKTDRPTSRPPPELTTDEAKTRPGKVAQLVEEPPSQGASVHATTTVAAPPIAEKVEQTEQTEEEAADDAAAAAPTPPPPPPKAAPVPKSTDTAVTRVADRDGLLARLRERRAAISDTDKEDILRKR